MFGFADPLESIGASLCRLFLFLFWAEIQEKDDWSEIVNRMRMR